MILKWLIGKWLWWIVIAGALAFIGGVYQAGYNSAWRKAEVQTKQVEIETLKRDLDIARIQKADAEKVRDEMEGLREQDERTLENLRRIVAGRPADAGRGLTQPELDGLLTIR